MTQLKTDKTALEKDILRMQKRIEELELQIGHDDEERWWRWDEALLYQWNYYFNSLIREFKVHILTLT